MTFHLISDKERESLMVDFFETVTYVKPSVGKSFYQILKSVKAGKKKSMYRIGKHPNSHMRRGGSRFSSSALMADAHSDDSTPLLKAAAKAFKKGGMMAAGAALDRRNMSDEAHNAKVKELLAVPSKKGGRTMAEALALSATFPETILSMTPARRLENKKILNKMVTDEMAKLKTKFGTKVKFEKTVHVIMGLPGAGKSKLADEIQKHHGAVLVDSDEFKKEIDGFREGLGANAVHAESSALGAAMQRVMLRKNANMVIPLVGKNLGKMQKQVKDFQSKGYKVVLHHVDIPVKFSKQRVVERYIASNRAVPLSVVEKTGTLPRAVFDAMRTKVDGWGAYSAHKIPGRDIRYAVLGTSKFKLPKE